ncbi:hypothetical protein OUZ56_000125 [Daphnia magna]|uniref:GMPS ATP-PPase domain-containing protein n=1 Tax=Daphnia magna TaxID=35525 RepID=A0ABQ9ZZ05_9CRUS|nr:hypothetical protein OUZ56_000125 [Daphnia magna]
MVRQLRLHGRVVEHFKDFHKDEVRTLGRELGLPVELRERHPFPGPGLSIRIIYVEELFMEADFEDPVLLEELSSSNQCVATLLPIRIVGVQGDYRTYSYCVALSSDKTQPNWNDLATYARLIPRVCHNVNRVCYIFGKAVRESVTDVTPTYLMRLPAIPDTHLPQEEFSGFYFKLFTIISDEKSPSNASHQVMPPYLIYHVTPTPTGR